MFLLKDDDAEKLMEAWKQQNTLQQIPKHTAISQTISNE